MINQASGSPSVPGQASVTEALPQRIETEPSTAPAGRSVATAFVPDSVEPLASQRTCQPQDQDGLDTPGLAGHLPHLVLAKIFSYLPPHSLSQCARVCRHWHAGLPNLRFRLTQWLQQHARPSWLTAADLARGFSNRTQPFLQAGNSMFLHPLRHLQQAHRADLVPRDTQQRPQPPACDLLSSLVHAALHHQQTRPPQLELHPAALVDWPEGAIAGTGGVAFSPCSRWLALSCQHQQESAPCLRLYGWEKDAWHCCPLVAEVTQPVSLLRFASTPPDTLLSVHGGDVLAWHKMHDSRTWLMTPVVRVPPSHRILNLYPMANGDQIIMASWTRETFTWLHILFCRPASDGLAWETVMTKTCDFAWDAIVLTSWTAAPQSCQLALQLTTRLQNSDQFRNEVNIWHTERSRPHPALWQCQTSVLPWSNTRLGQITFSPDGRYLLGILPNKRACLWTLDAQYRLQGQRVLPVCLYNPDSRLESQISFRRDGRQLAVAISSRQVQLFYCDGNDRWLYGSVLEAPPAPEIPANDKTRALQLSSSGRSLVRQTDWRLDIWHQDPVAGWHHLVEHKRQENHRYLPQFCLLQPGEQICITVEDPELVLRIYGPDSRSGLVQKNCMPVTTRLRGPDGASPDGLSVLLGGTLDPPGLLQLVAADRTVVEQASGRTAADRPGS
ncbi:MAG: F-box protein [Kistimonas sp.]|nr:F-box protein [Kistimonas sp.]